MVMPENTLLSNSRTIEQIARTVPRCGYRSVLLDWDGTISLIREGWQDIMEAMMVEELLNLNTGESEDELKKLVAGYIDELTGKQTIYQMLRLCEELNKRKGKPEDAAAYSRKYKQLLKEHIGRRIEMLLSGEVQPANLMLPGILDLLENLSQRGMVLYLASGTDHENVLHETRLLGVSGYFGERIFGARDQYHTFSKAMVVQHILKVEGITGTKLIGFGDGTVEIEDVKAVGGTAIGVAFNEASGEGIDLRKRDRLIKAGADFIIPDFREQDILITCLSGAS